MKEMIKKISFLRDNRYHSVLMCSCRFGPCRPERIVLCYLFKRVDAEHMGYLVEISDIENSVERDEEQQQHNEEQQSPPDDDKPSLGVILCLDTLFCRIADEYIDPSDVLARRTVLVFPVLPLDLISDPPGKRLKKAHCSTPGRTEDTG